MDWFAGLVVEVLVKWVELPKQTDVAVKLAVGLGEIWTVVVAVTEWVPTVVTQV